MYVFYFCSLATLSQYQLGLNGASVRALWNVQLLVLGVSHQLIRNSRTILLTRSPSFLDSYNLFRPSLNSNIVIKFLALLTICLSIIIICQCFHFHSYLVVRWKRKIHKITSFFSCLLWLLFHSLWVFHAKVRRWSFSGVWVTVSLLRSPGHFSVFWPTSKRTVWLLPLISNSFCLLSRFWGTVPSAPTTTSTAVNLIFHSFQFSSKAQEIVYLFAFFSPSGLPERQNPQNRKFSFFLLINISLVFWSGLGDPLIAGFLFEIYQLVVSSNFNFLFNSQWITFPTLLCLV